MKVAAGFVVALVLGCAIGYGIAIKMPMKTGVMSSGGSNSDAGEAIFEYDGKTYTENDLPVDVKTSIYDFKKEAVHKIDSMVNQFAMRLDLARQQGRDKEVPVPGFEDLLKVEKPSDDEITKMYEANKDRLPPGTTFEQIKPDIEKYMLNQKMGEVLQAKAAEFKANNKYKFLMSMPLAPVVNIDTSKMVTTGSKDAKVSIVEVADYLCPHCQMVQTEVEAVVAEMGSSIKFSPVAFSLRPEGLSGQLARGAFCAKKQGEEKFWAWHKSAFSIAKGKGWKVSDPESMDAVKEVLASVQLDNAALEACINSDEAKTAVADLVKSMNELGVSSTPTFFVNGRRIDFHGGNLKEEIEKLVKASSH